MDDRVLVYIGNGKRDFDVRIDFATVIVPANVLRVADPGAQDVPANGLEIQCYIVVYLDLLSAGILEKTGFGVIEAVGNCVSLRVGGCNRVSYIVKTFGIV